MYDYYNDKDFKFEYEPVNNKFQFAKNAIGAQAAVSIDEETHTATDTNSIFVKKAGNDSNAGTEASPKLTLLASINACTSTKIYVVVDDSNLYSEELDSADNDNFAGIYAASGETPTYTLRVLDYTPADANSIYVSKAGNDSTGDGTSGNPYLTVTEAIDNVDGSHQAVVVDDSGTYEEYGFDFTGDFLKLVASLGENPTIEFKADPARVETASIKLVETVFETELLVAGLAMTITSADYIVFLYQKTFNDHLYYKIMDTSGSVVLTSTLFVGNNSLIGSEAMAVLSNDYIVIGYQDVTDGDKGQYAIADIAGNFILTETTFHNAATGAPSIAVLSNDTIVIAYQDKDDNRYGKFVIMDSTGATIKSETTFAAYDQVSGISLGVLSNDDFVIAYSSTVTDFHTHYIVYDQVGEVVLAETENGDMSGTSICVSVLPNDDFVFSNGTNLAMKIMDKTGATVLSRFFTGDINATAVINKVFSNGTVLLSWHDSVLSKYYYSIFDVSGTELETPVELNPTAVSYNGVVLTSDNDIVGGYLESPGGDYYYTIYDSYRYDCIEVSSASVINGINLTSKDENFIYRFIFGQANLTMGWCNVSMAKNANRSNNAYAIYTTFDGDINNSAIFDNDIGVYIEENESIIEDCLFYFNSYSYALHINGAAAGSGDITVNHVSFFSNQSGLRLQGNGGSNEIVKNNIIHANSVYGINATTAMTYTYTINTDSNLNASAGASAVSANPLFINEGDVSPSLTDLTLKLRVLGYFADSPAYQLGDDTDPDRDAGGWNVVPIGNPTTWTSATIEKPASGIGVSYLPVGQTIVIKKDGSSETAKNAYREEVTIMFVGILNADWDVILAIALATSNLIRFYPDPTTNSGNFNLYTLEYIEVNGSVNNFRLSRTGKQDAKIVFSRAYSG